MKGWSKSLLAAAVVGWAGAALAQPAGGGGPEFGMRKEARMEQALREAGATDEQVAKLREQIYQARKQMISLHAEKEQAEIEVQHLMMQDKVDREAVLKAVEKLGAVKTSLHRLRIQQQLDMREIVGPDVARKVRAGAADRWREKRQGRGEGKWRGEMDRPHKGCPFQPSPPPEPEEMPEMEELETE